MVKKAIAVILTLGSASILGYEAIVGGTPDWFDLICGAVLIVSMRDLDLGDIREVLVMIKKTKKDEDIIGD